MNGSRWLIVGAFLVFVLLDLAVLLTQSTLAAVGAALFLGVSLGAAWAMILIGDSNDW